MRSSTCFHAAFIALLFTSCASIKPNVFESETPKLGPMKFPDGQTLIIRSIIRKFGVIVQEITEGFRRL